MAKREIVLESFEFTEEDPKFTPRTPYKWMSNDEKESIAHYPYILDAQCPFCASFKVDGNPVTLRGVVPKGFTYNLADIHWLLEPIAYDKHSPFVKDASFIHDYMVNSIFLPVTGYKNDDDIFNAATGGYYWSSSLLNEGSSRASYLLFDIKEYDKGDYARRYSGRNIRPVFE